MWLKILTCYRHDYTCSTDEMLILDFLENLKLLLQNFEKSLKKYYHMDIESFQSMKELCPLHMHHYRFHSISVFCK